MKYTALMVFFYSLIVALGGLVGYIKAGSLPSLIMGILFGVVLAACSYGIWKKTVWGFISALTASSILTIFFAIRYFQSGKMFPGGAMAILSLLIVILLFSTKNIEQ